MPIDQDLHRVLAQAQYDLQQAQDRVIRLQAQLAQQEKQTTDSPHSPWLPMEKRLEKAIRYGTHQFTLTDRDGIIIYSNVRDPLLGSEPGQSLWPKHLPVHDQMQVQDFLQTIVNDETPTPHMIELCLLNLQGVIIWIEIKATNALHDPDLQAIIFVTTDVTARKHVERQSYFLVNLLTVTERVEAPQSTFAAVLRLMAQTMEWVCADSWISDDDTVLESSGIDYIADWASDAIKGFIAYSRTQVFVPSEGLVGRVWSTRLLEAIPDLNASTDSIFYRLAPAQEAGLRSVIAIPIIVRQQVKAVFCFYSLRPLRQYDSVLHTMRVAGQQGEAAIERKYGEFILKRYDQWMTVLHEIDESLIRSHSTDGLIEGVLTHLRTIFSCQSVLLLIQDDLSDNWVQYTSDERHTPFFSKSTPLRMPASIFSHFPENNIHIVSDLWNLPMAYATYQHVLPPGLRSLFQIRLMAYDRPIGILALLSTQEKAFKRDDREIILPIAYQLTIALHQARLTMDLAHHAAKLEQSLTELHLREESLSQSETRYRSVVEDHTDFICRYDSNLHLRFANQAYGGLYNKTPEQMVGRSLLDVIPLEEQGETIAHIHSLNSAHPVATHENSTITPHQGWRWIQWTDRAIFDREGNIVEYQGVGRDITLQKKLQLEKEQHIRTVEDLSQFLRAALDAFPASTVVVDRDGTILNANASWMRFGSENNLQAPESMIGTNYLTVCDQSATPDGTMAATGIRAVIQGEAQDFYMEYPCHSPVEQRWFGMRVSPFEEPVPRRVLVVHLSITERKLAEQAVQDANSVLEQRVFERTAELNQAKSRVEAILHNSTEGIVLAYADTGIEQVNSTFNTLFACSQEAYHGQPLTSLVHADERTVLTALVASVQTSGLSSQHEFRALRRDGTVFEAQIGLGIMRGTDVTQEGFVCTIHDITLLKQRENQLRYYGSLQENVSDAVISTDLEFRIQSWNRAAEAIYGWTAAEVIGEKVNHILKTSYSSPQARHQDIQQLLTQGAWYQEALQQRKDGSTLYVMASINLIKDGHGHPIGIVAVNHDITEHKERERQFRYHASLQQSVSDAVITTDLEMYIKSWNPAAESIYGWSAEEAIGKPVHDILICPYVTPEEADRNQAALLGNGFWQGELIQRHKNGLDIHILESISLLRDENDIPYGIVAVNHDITTQKRVEDTLRESEARYRLLADHITDVVVRYNTSGQYSYVSPSSGAVLGYEPREMIGHWAHEFVHPDDVILLKNEYAEALQGNMTMFRTYRYRHKEGHYLWLEVASRVVRSATGEIIEFIASSRDITERKHAENALSLKLQEDFQFQTSLKQLHEISIELTQIDQLDEFYRRVVEFAVHQLGFERFALFLYDVPNQLAVGTYGTNTQGTVISEAHIRFNFFASPGLLARTLKRTEHFSFDVDTPLYENQQFVTRGWNACACLRSGSEVLGWLVADNAIHHKDVTKPLMDILNLYSLTVGSLLSRKRLEVALRESEEKFRLLVEAAPVAIIISDETGHVLIVNEKAQSLFGYRRDELLMQPITILMPSHRPENHDFSQIISERPDGYSRDGGLFARRKNGTEFPVELELNHIQTKAGTLTMSFIVDITTRKEAETALKQALHHEKELNELKTRFVSMASHEFRTPLATILALNETITAYRTRMTETQIEDRLFKIRDQIQRLKNIIEDVLQLARLQARRMEFAPTRLDVDALCRSVMDEFQNPVESIYQWQYHCDPLLHDVKLDGKLLRQIINNLLSNAIKYSSIGKTIRVSLELVDQCLVLRIQDEGIGIPVPDLDHLFEPFHRAANVETIAGTGLGLSIVREAVDIHGGTIQVESRVGFGTTFIVQLPLQP